MILRLSRAELSEVLSSLRDDIGKEFEFYTAEWLSCSHLSHSSFLFPPLLSSKQKQKMRCKHVTCQIGQRCLRKSMQVKQRSNEPPTVISKKTLATISNTSRDNHGRRWGRVTHTGLPEAGNCVGGMFPSHVKVPHGSLGIGIVRCKARRGCHQIRTRPVRLLPACPSGT